MDARETRLREEPHISVRICPLAKISRQSRFPRCRWNDSPEIKRTAVVTRPQWLSSWLCTGRFRGIGPNKSLALIFHRTSRPATLQAGLRSGPREVRTHDMAVAANSRSDRESFHFVVGSFCQRQSRTNKVNIRRSRSHGRQTVGFTRKTCFPTLWQAWLPRVRRTFT